MDSAEGKEMEGTLVLVTGASGFIASHVVQKLLEAKYKVRGTVRSLSNEPKVKHLKNLCPNSAFPLELVEADLTNKESWISAVKDCVYVVHIASPFPVASPKDENEVIVPAVEGTKSVLEACASTPTVKRVVLTSSVAAVADLSTYSPGTKVTEANWPNVDGLDPYSKSKTMAEKAAWDFMKEISDSDRHEFELAVINPGFVLGPILSGSNCTSMEVIKRLMNRNPPLIAKINFSVVDVRDVAAAHINAMTLPDAKGERFIITAGNMWIADMSRILNEEFRSQGYSPAQTEAPKFLFNIVALFDSAAKRVAPFWGVEMVCDNSKMKTVLKIEPHPLKQTIVDMAYSMIDSGFLKKTAQYRKRNQSGGESGQQKASTDPTSSGGAAAPAADGNSAKQPSNQEEAPSQESQDSAKQPSNQEEAQSQDSTEK